MEEDLVCCVISSWNRLDILRQNIDAIYKQDYQNKEIIVIDNCSNDGTQEYLKDKYENQCKWDFFYEIMPHSKFTAMQTLNRGFWIAKYDHHAKYILVLDDDCILQETNSISKLVEVAKSKKDVGMVACNVRGPENKIPQTDFKFALNTHINLKSLPRNPFRVYDYIGACALYNTDIFSGYDESFGIYWNESDTALNILSRGHDVLFEKNVQPIHLYSPKQRNVNKGVYYYIKNGNTIINRYLSFKNRLVLIPLRLATMMIWVWRFKDIKLVIKAILISILGLIQIFYMKDRVKPINDTIQNEINQAYTGWYFRKFYEWIFGYSIYEGL